MRPLYIIVGDGTMDWKSETFFAFDLKPCTLHFSIFNFGWWEMPLFSQVTTLLPQLFCLSPTRSLKKKILINTAICLHWVVRKIWLLPTQKKKKVLAILLSMIALSPPCKSGRRAKQHSILIILTLNVRHYKATSLLSVMHIFGMVWSNGG